MKEFLKLGSLNKKKANVKGGYELWNKWQRSQPPVTSTTSPAEMTDSID